MQIIRERKFTSSLKLKERALAILEHHCFPDPAYPKGIVNSIYYDSYCLKSYNEKLEGDNLKLKIRIRWYDQWGSSQVSQTKAFIEVKCRIGAARRKSRKEISVPGNLLYSTPLEDKRLVDLLYDHSGNFEDLIPLDLMPVVSISYERQCYVCPRSRGGLCIDMNIQGNRYNSKLFCASNSVSSNMVICEFKDPGIEDLPLGQDLYFAVFKLRSFSKYGECVS